VILSNAPFRIKPGEIRDVISGMRKNKGEGAGKENKRKENEKKDNVRGNFLGCIMQSVSLAVYLRCGELDAEFSSSVQRAGVTSVSKRVRLKISSKVH